MTYNLHIDACLCNIKHDDVITSEGKKNLTTYEIDYYCHMNGVRAGEGTTWAIKAHNKD